MVVTCKKTPEVPDGTNKKELPTVVTSNVSDITVNSAVCGGNVINNGNCDIISRGVCWGNEQGVTLETCDGFTEDGVDTGEFTSNISSLVDGDMYYVVAYATNERGTMYGTPQEFTTLAINIPTVETHEVTDIDHSSALSGGSITDNGMGTINEYGICWNLSGNTILDNCLGFTTEENNSSTFTSKLTNLNDGTTYYVVAYATNEKGTGYGEIQSFETLDLTPCDGQTTIDYQGQTYSIIGIGYQCWMAENLNYQTGNSWCYENNTANCDVYGRLYDWETIMNGESSSNSVPSGVQGICPDGWHLPSDEEWKVIEMHLGMSQSEANSTGYRGTDEGEKLKSISGWYNSGNGINSSGFTALPGVSRNSDESFDYLGYYGFWWSTTAQLSTNPWRRSLNYGYNQVGRSDYGSKPYGFSVRCLKN